jgi:hypothetical protein
MATDTTTTLAALLTDGSIAARYALNIADRNSFLQHPVIAASYIADLAGMKSTTAEKSAYGFGANGMSSVAEAGTTSETALATAALTATVAPFTLQREMTTLVQTIVGDPLSASTLIAEDLALAATAGMMNQICDVIDGFTNTESNTATDLSLAHFLSALGTYSAQNMRGPIMGVLHSVQWSDLSTNIATTSSGSIALSDAGAQLARYTSGAYKGNFMGVDIFVSNRVVTANAGADRAGAIFGPDGIVWATATPTVDSPAQQALYGAGVLPMLVDLDRTGATGVTELTGRIFLGVSKGLENGVTIISGAT